MEKGKLKIECLISAGELIDKISVLEIKKKHIKNKTKLKNICLEMKSLRSKCKTLPGYKKWINKIKIINYKIWVSVHKIWLHEKRGIFNRRFIDLSRNIYILNDKRYLVKNEINKYYKSYICEQKKY